VFSDNLLVKCHLLGKEIFELVQRLELGVCPSYQQKNLCLVSLISEADFVFEVEAVVVALAEA